MKENVLILDEFIARVHITKKTLKEWEKLHLINPAGYTDNKIPLYLDNTINEVKHIQKLLELGYNLEDIQRIIKKIGLPSVSNGKVSQTKLGQYLTVGNLAERVGVSSRTIKYWEDKGIIEPDTRSEGGFRLYSEAYVYLCKLIKDLQLFGYTLEKIKSISDYFRDFLNFQKDFKLYSKAKVDRKLDSMLEEVQILFEKMNLLKEGIQRWEDLLKKKKKEILNLKNQNQKRSEKQKGSKK